MSDDGTSGSDAYAFFTYINGATVPQNVTHARIDSAVRVVPQDAFQGRLRLKVVIFTEGLVVIGRSAFRMCTSLEEIILPSTLAEIGGNAFACCTSLRRVTLCEGLRKMSAGAFEECLVLERIALPSTLTLLCNGVFGYCTSLREVTLGAGIRKIGDRAFIGCESLVALVAPPTLTTIGDRALNYCTSLNGLTLRGGIQSVPANAFQNSLLENITVLSNAFFVEDGITPACRVAMNCAVPRTDRQLVVIASECFHTIHIAELYIVRDRIGAIFTEHGSGGDTMLERIREFCVHCELERRKEVTALLELGLWKVMMVELRGAGPGAREACRARCGAQVVVTHVVPFL